MWTDVEVLWQKSGSVTVSFNGLVVGGVTGATTTSTKISASLGTVTSGAAVGVGVGRHTYDNVVVSVKRQP